MRRSAALVFLAVVACSGGSGTDLVDAAPIVPDAAPVIDAGPHVCLTPDDFGTPALHDPCTDPDPANCAPLAQGVGDDHANPDAITYFAAMDTNPFPDEVQLELITGYGVFTNGISTGTFPLTGDELDYETCGMCVRLFADVGGDDMQQYFATGGTVTITSINPNITGSFTGLTYVEVKVDPDTFHVTPIADGCSTQIASGSFDEPVSYP
jgi:hypothetical protein